MISVQENVEMPPSSEPLSTTTTTMDSEALEVESNEVVPRVTTCADLIARVLGAEYRVASDATKDARLATVYNNRMFRLVGSPNAVELPRLNTLPAWNKLFIKSGKVEQKHALVCDFVPRWVVGQRDETAGTSSSVLRSVNFHLDAAGSNRHRKRQMASLLPLMSMPSSINSGCAPNHHIVSGDTNIFHVSNATQKVELQSAIESLSPFVSLVESDGSALKLDTPTHFFARGNEPTMLHQAGVLVWRHFGVDRPQCYDVVLTSLQVCDRGQVSTPDCSDHDLVFATLAMGGLRKT
jgi:hypothetical protein